ncbi:hypothetical protein JOF28_001442 [Leucobacter exalbidus]|uniref:Glycosyl transferase family 11 n=1 Tax=Leucobacter exalbidus TaxID=662960 RepID=A0A940PU15_9MICO|nr:alpha-1,2-fucosyltransferase [Leucobacter exalbidus]MBP1326210.1 hypothetical protein [Leucobacter exalbidus]
MSNLLQRMKTGMLETVRRHGREVAWTAPWMRLGNYLMLGLWANDGVGRKILRHPGSQLIDLFPNFTKEFMLDPGEVRFTDQRLKPWSGQADDRLDWEQVHKFVQSVLLPQSPLTHMHVVPDDALVVNVRRGDYYSVPEHRATFGINIEEYVQTALDQAVQDDGRPLTILVVSDDIKWCREHLDGMLGAVAPTSYRPQGDPAGDLAALVHAKRLIVPNSTFSMWGGYIGDVVHPGRKVYAPWLFARGLNGGKGMAYHPDWTIIEDIPGGWDQISE